MASESYSASGPGSIMLLGEHAVLHGKQALACAVNQRIHVKLTPREDSQVHISSALGDYSSSLEQLKPSNIFRFLVAVIQHFQPHMSYGVDLVVKSEFSSTIGLGSSAAVTAAAVAVFSSWLGQPTTANDLYRQTIQVIRSVQGAASGTDVAATVFGGLIAYRMKPLAIRRLHHTPPLVLVYSGHKEPTPKVIALVEQARRAQPRLFHDLFGLMDQSVQEAVVSVETQNWSRLGALLNFNQGLMDAMGVNTPALAELVFTLRTLPGILGAKISGSGLGDCVVGLGQADVTSVAYTVIPVAISSEGVVFE